MDTVSKQYITISYVKKLDNNHMFISYINIRYTHIIIIKGLKGHNGVELKLI